MGTGALAGAAGLAAAGTPGAAAPGFAGIGEDGVAAGGVDGEAVFSEGALTSAWAEPDGVAFTPPGTGVESAVGFGSPSGGGEEGDLISSGITANAQTSGVQGYG